MDFLKRTAIVFVVVVAGGLLYQHMLAHNLETFLVLAVVEAVVVSALNK